MTKNIQVVFNGSKLKEITPDLEPIESLFMFDSPLALSSISVQETRVDTTEITSAFIAEDRSSVTAPATGRKKLENKELLGLHGLKWIDKKEQNFLTIKFKPPYGDKFKKVLIDMGENDDIVDSCLQIISYCAFGTKKELKVYPTGQHDFNDDEELQKELTALGLDKQNYQDLLKFIREVESLTDFDNMLQVACYDALQGGRTGLLFETFTEGNQHDFPVGTPSLLKPMSWYFMGQNLVNKIDWKVRYIENLDADSEAEDSWIPIGDMIYFTWRDSNRNPNRLTYGRSELHAVVKYSNILRQAAERDMPEIVSTFWTQTGVLSVPDEMDKEVQAEIINNLSNGGIAIVDQRANFTPVPLKHDGWFLIQAIDFAKRRILARMRVPEFLVNFEAQSRSVVESGINSFRDFRITPIRKWGLSIIGAQWYKKLLGLFVKWKKLKEDIVDTIEIVPVYEEFSVEDLLSRANSIELLVRRDVATIREARRFYLKLPEKRLEDTKADINAMVERKTAEAEAIAAANPFNQMVNGAKPVTPANAPGANFGIKPPVQRLNARPVAKQGAGAGRQV